MAFLKKISGKYYVYFKDAKRSPKEKSHPTGTGNRRLALAELNRRHAMYLEGTWDPWNPNPELEDERFEDAVDIFIEEGDRRASTNKTYRTLLEQFAGLLPTSRPMLSQVRPSDVASFVRDPSVKPTTRHMRWRHVSAFFSEMVKSGMLGENPCDKVRAPKKVSNPQRFFSPDELRQLMAYMRSFEGRKPIGYLIDMTELALATGARQAALRHMRWQDCDFDNGYIYIRSDEEFFTTKNGSGRAIAMVDLAREVLTRRPRIDDLVFSNNGVPFTKDQISKRFKLMVRRSGVPEELNFKSLRHTTASWLVMSGATLYQVQGILGHKSQEMTQNYAHLRAEATRAQMDATLRLNDKTDER